MTYIITRPKPRVKKMSFEDILLDVIKEKDLVKYCSKDKYPTDTRTNCFDRINITKVQSEIIENGLERLKIFRNLFLEEIRISSSDSYCYAKQLYMQKDLERKYLKENKIVDEDKIQLELEKNMAKLGLRINPYYYTFYLPKRSGRGFRQIDAPLGALKTAQSILKDILEELMNYNTYHTSAYAYIPKRSRVDLVKKLKNNKSRWILHLDFNDFFGSIDIDFTMRQLEKIFPFSEMIKQGHKDLLKECLQVCFLDGKLPQGTPISPLLTNIIMIPLDYKISNALNNNAMDITTFDNPVEGQNYNLIYTRYADDIYIGSHRGFRYVPVINKIREIIAEEKAPLKIKDEKTKYKSTSGENWILGLMYNKDQEITVGHKRKKQTQAIISNFAMDYKNGKISEWTTNDIQVAMGHIQYIGQIEPEYYRSMLDKYNCKFGFDVMEKMREVAYGMN